METLAFRVADCQPRRHASAACKPMPICRPGASPAVERR